jgi:hypothetical protein
MADGGFFGDLTRPAEIDLCAANYLRHRIRLASEAMQRVLDDLEGHAQEFLNRGEEQLRALAPEGTSPEVAQAQSEMFLSFLTAHLAKSEPGPERIALCNRMIVEAGATNELQTILWLLGEELALPPETEAGSRQPQRQAQPARQPAAVKEQAKESVKPAAAERRSAPSHQDLIRDVFFGVKVPEHETEKGYAILADARERAARNGNLNDSPYVNARGRNDWQLKLLKAAFEAATGQSGAGRPTAEVPPQPPVRPAPAPSRVAAAQPAAQVEPIVQHDDLREAEVEEVAQEVHEEVRAEEAIAPEADVQANVHEDDAEPVEMSAEPVEELFGEADETDQDGEAMGADETQGGLFAEPLDETDEAPVMTEPLAPPPRPQPTVMPPPSPAAPPVRPASGAGLMSANVGQRPRPTFAPPRTGGS